MQNLLFFDKEGNPLNFNYDETLGRYEGDILFAENSNETFKTQALYLFEKVPAFEYENETDLSLRKFQLFNEYGLHFYSGADTIKITKVEPTNDEISYRSKWIYGKSIDAKFKKGTFVRFDQSVFEFTNPNVVYMVVSSKPGAIMIISGLTNDVFTSTYLEQYDLDDSFSLTGVDIIGIYNYVTPLLKDTLSLWNEPDFYDRLYENRKLNIVNSLKNDDFRNTLRLDDVNVVSIKNPNILDAVHIEYSAKNLPIDSTLYIEYISKTDLPNVYTGPLTFNSSLSRLEFGFEIPKIFKTGLEFKVTNSVLNYDTFLKVGNISAFYGNPGLVIYATGSQVIWENKIYQCIQAYTYSSSNSTGNITGGFNLIILPNDPEYWSIPDYLPVVTSSSSGVIVDESLVGGQIYLTTDHLYYTQPYTQSSKVTMAVAAEKFKEDFKIFGIDLFFNIDTLKADLVYPSDYAKVNFYYDSISATGSFGGKDFVYEKCIEVDERLNHEFNYDYSENFEYNIVFTDIDEAGIVIKINKMVYSERISYVFSSGVVDMQRTIDKTLRNWLTRHFLRLNILGILPSLKTIGYSSVYYNSINLQTEYPNVPLEFTVQVGTTADYYIEHSLISFLDIGMYLSLRINGRTYIVNAISTGMISDVAQTLQLWVDTWSETVDDFGIYITNNAGALRVNVKKQSQRVDISIDIGKSSLPGIQNYIVSDKKQGNFGTLITSNEMLLGTQTGDNSFELEGFSTGQIVGVNKTVYPLQNIEYNSLYLNPDVINLSYEGPFWGLTNSICNSSAFTTVAFTIGFGQTGCPPQFVPNLLRGMFDETQFSTDYSIEFMTSNVYTSFDFIGVSGMVDIVHVQPNDSIYVLGDSIRVFSSIYGDVSADINIPGLTNSISLLYNWVSNYLFLLSRNTLYKIDPFVNIIIATFSFTEDAHSQQLNTSNGDIYVSFLNSNKVNIYSVSSSSPIVVGALPGNTFEMVFNDFEKDMYVSTDVNLVLRIDGLSRTLQTSYSVTGLDGSIAYDPENEAVYASGQTDLYKIDNNTVSIVSAITIGTDNYLLFNNLNSSINVSSDIGIGGLLVDGTGPLSMISGTVSETLATLNFQITTNGATYDDVALNIDGSTIGIYPTTNADTSVDIADGLVLEINLSSNTHGYTAVANSNNILVTAPVGSGNTSNISIGTIELSTDSITEIQGSASHFIFGDYVTGDEVIASFVLSGSTTQIGSYFVQAGDTHSTVTNGLAAEIINDGSWIGGLTTATFSLNAGVAGNMIFTAPVGVGSSINGGEISLQVGSPAVGQVLASTTIFITTPGQFNSQFQLQVSTPQPGTFQLPNYVCVAGETLTSMAAAYAALVNAHPSGMSAIANATTPGELKIIVPNGVTTLGNSFTIQIYTTQLPIVIAAPHAGGAIVNFAGYLPASGGYVPYYLSPAVFSGGVDGVLATTTYQSVGNFTGGISQILPTFGILDQLIFQNGTLDYGYMALNQFDGDIYVAGSNAGYILTIDSTTGLTINTEYGGPPITKIIYNPDRKSIWAIRPQDGRVIEVQVQLSSFFDVETVSATGVNEDFYGSLASGYNDRNYLWLNVREYIRQPRQNFNGDPKVSLYYKFFSDNVPQFFMYDFSGDFLPTTGKLAYTGEKPLPMPVLNRKANRDLSRVADSSNQQTIFDTLEFDLDYIDDNYDISVVPEPIQLFLGFNSPEEGGLRSVLQLYIKETVDFTIDTSLDVTDMIFFVNEFDQRRNRSFGRIFLDNLSTSLFTSDSDGNQRGLQVGQHLAIFIKDVTNSKKQYVSNNSGYLLKIRNVFSREIIVDYFKIADSLDVESTLIEDFPSFGSTTYLSVRFVVWNREIARFNLFGQTEIEDERFHIELNNVGKLISSDDVYIFKEYDIKEEGIDWNYLNSKRKEMLMMKNLIYPYIGSYKSIINAINYFGYNDLELYEYYQNVNFDSEDFLKLFKVEIPDIFDNTVEGWTDNDFIKNTFPNSNYEDTNLFNLTYRITDKEGNNILYYTVAEVQKKLQGLKYWLQKNIIPITHKILDITGRADFNGGYTITHQSRDAQLIKIHQNFTPITFNMNEAYLLPVNSGSSVYNCVLDFVVRQGLSDTLLPDSYTVDIRTYEIYREWYAFKNYEIGNRVIYYDKLYESVSDGNKTNNPRKFENVSEWIDNSIYVAGDLVKYDRKFYIWSGQSGSTSSSISPTLDSGVGANWFDVTEWKQVDLVPVEKISEYRPISNLKPFNFTVDSNITPYLVIEVTSDNGYGMIYRDRKNFEIKGILDIQELEAFTNLTAKQYRDATLPVKYVDVTKTPELNLLALPFKNQVQDQFGNPSDRIYLSSYGQVITPHIKHSFPYIIGNSSSTDSVSTFRIELSGDFITMQNPYVISNIGSANVTGRNLDWSGNLQPGATLSIELITDVTTGGRAYWKNSPNTANNQSLVPLTYSVVAMLATGVNYGLTYSTQGFLTPRYHNLYDRHAPISYIFTPTPATQPFPNGSNGPGSENWSFSLVSITQSGVNLINKLATYTTNFASVVDGFNTIVKKFGYVYFQSRVTGPMVIGSNYRPHILLATYYNYQIQSDVKTIQITSATAVTRFDTGSQDTSGLLFGTNSTIGNITITHSYYPI